MSDRDETPDEIVRRLQANWDRYKGRCADVLMRSINCVGSGEAFFWTGIERDLVVYALALNSDDLRARIETLEAAVDRFLVCGNHIALYKSDRWPEYALDGLTRVQQCEHALRVLGAGQDYDMWCCWSGMMQERERLNQQRTVEPKS